MLDAMSAPWNYSIENKGLLETKNSSLRCLGLDWPSKAARFWNSSNHEFVDTPAVILKAVAMKP
jgi:hypothetical protein